MSKIEKRNEFKTMFQVGKISCSLLHDLISPITSLGLYTENINNSELKEVINPIIKTTEDIKKFIALIQDAVENPDKFSTINLYGTINHALDLGRHKIITNGVVVDFDFRTTKTITLYCKKLEIYQIIMNLVGNAVDALIKTSRKNKTIKIEVFRRRNIVHINIKDNGSGIPKNIQTKIFNKSFTTKENGMGIGLYTVKRIVENSLGGQIDFNSKIGFGTEFKIKIPITKKSLRNVD